MNPYELKQARHTLGLSQKQLGATIQVDPRTIRRWEAGDCPIPGPVEVLIKILLERKDGSKNDEQRH